MKDTKILGIILICIGMFGLIATILMAEVATTFDKFDAVEPWLGASLVFDFIWVIIGLGIFNIKKTP
jgi:hypothetical protein